MTTHWFWVFSMSLMLRRQQLWVGNIVWNYYNHTGRQLSAHQWLTKQRLFFKKIILWPIVVWKLLHNLKHPASDLYMFFWAVSNSKVSKFGSILWSLIHGCCFTVTVRILRFRLNVFSVNFISKSFLLVGLVFFFLVHI